jgi:hypothetical protein
MRLVMEMLPRHFPVADKPLPATTGRFLLRPLLFVHVKEKRDPALEFEKRQWGFCRTYDSYE